MKKVKVNLVTYSSQTSMVWHHYIENVLNMIGICFSPYHFNTLSHGILEADLWIIEVFDTYYNNDPIGFRTAIQLAGKKKLLLIFNGNIMDKNFPDEGPFWITYGFTGSLKNKINELIFNPPLPKENYDKLIKKYPQLNRRPPQLNHH